MQLFGEKLLFQAIKMTYPKTKLPPITCRGDQKWTKIWPQKPKIGSNWTLLGALKATPKRRRFERVLTLIPKVGPKLTQKWSKEVKNDQNWVKRGKVRKGSWDQVQKDGVLKGSGTKDPKTGPKDPKFGPNLGSKMTKIGSNLGFGARLGIFRAKRTVGTPKMSQRPFSGFENWFWQGFLARGQADCRKSRFPGLVWKGWRGKFGRMIFCYKNEKSVWKFFDERKMGKMKIM